MAGSQREQEDLRAITYKLVVRLDALENQADASRRHE